MTNPKPSKDPTINKPAWIATEDLAEAAEVADDGELPDIKNDPVPEDDAAVDHEPPQNPGG